MDKKNIPNVITCIRIVGAVSLLFLEPFNLVFYIVYGLCGFTDILDGFLARRWKITSTLGARLDTIADFSFYAAMLYHLLPYLFKTLDTRIWYLTGVVAVLRIFSYSFVAIRFRCLASLHTYLNKLTGLSVFFMPYFTSFDFFEWYCWIVCGIALVAAVYEIGIHIKRAVKKEDKTKVKA